MAHKTSLETDHIAMLAVIHAPNEQEKNKVLDRMMKGASFSCPSWLMIAIKKSEKALVA
jgi:hypothetical protein